MNAMYLLKIHNKLLKKNIGDNMNITDIASECVVFLTSKHNIISIDDVYDEAHAAFEDIIGDVALEIMAQLKEKGIEVKD